MSIADYMHRRRLAHHSATGGAGSLSQCLHLLADLGVAIGPVIASIHEKRDQVRQEIKLAAGIDRTPRLTRTTARRP